MVEVEKLQLDLDKLLNFDHLGNSIKEVVSNQVKIAKRLNELQDALTTLATRKQFHKFANKLSDGFSSHDGRIAWMDKQLKRATDVEESMPKLKIEMISDVERVGAAQGD